MQNHPLCRTCFGQYKVTIGQEAQIEAQHLCICCHCYSSPNVNKVLSQFIGAYCSKGTSQLAGRVPNTTSIPSQKFIPTMQTFVPPVIHPSEGYTAMMQGFPAQEERGDEYTKVMCSYQLTLETHKVLSHPCLVGNGSCMAKLCRQVGGSLQFRPHQTVQKMGSNLQKNYAEDRIKFLRKCAK